MKNDTKDPPKVAIKSIFERNLRTRIIKNGIRTITPSDSLSNPSQQTRSSSLEPNSRHGIVKFHRKDKCNASLLTNGEKISQYSSRSADRKRGESPAEYCINNKAMPSKSTNVSKIEEIYKNEAESDYNTIHIKSNNQRLLADTKQTDQSQKINKIRYNLRSRRILPVNYMK